MTVPGPGAEGRIYVDFMKVDDEGRLILTTRGTLEDLEREGIVLEDGMELRLYSDDLDEDGERDDLIVDAVARWDPEAGRWVAEYDPDEVVHVSDLGDGPSED